VYVHLTVCLSTQTSLRAQKLFCLAKTTTFEMADALTVALQGHDRFFARIIDTIPPALYKHTVSEDAEGAQEAKYAKVCTTMIYGNGQNFR
jgi:hypothetical protein